MSIAVVIFFFKLTNRFLAVKIIILFLSVVDEIEIPNINNLIDMVINLNDSSESSLLKRNELTLKIVTFLIMKMTEICMTTIRTILIEPDMLLYGLLDVIFAIPIVLMMLCLMNDNN
jgi:hypothetical protein